MKPVGLYIHIPFCHVKCKFCDFAAYPGLLKEIPRYLSALEKEMARHDGKAVDTVFIGGGTPSVLSSGGLARLFSSIRRHFRLEDDLESTVECNPETVTQEKLETLQGCGVNRLSFGLQAAQDSLLKSLGRLHDFEAFKRAYLLARAAGFKNINVDLMYGLPKQTMAQWRETVNEVLALEPEHLSAYALSVEERTNFGRNGVEADGDLQADMYEWLSERLQSAGYSHYEISNFAKPGFECRHNLRYWKNEPCLGLGVSAAGYENGARRTNTAKVADYISAMEEGRAAVIEEVRLPEEEKVGEDLMLALRLKEGARLNHDMRRLYGPVIEKYSGLGFLNSDSTHARPTLKGWLLSNQMFEELLRP